MNNMGAFFRKSIASGFTVGVLLPVSLAGFFRCAAERGDMSPEAFWIGLTVLFRWGLVPGDVVLGLFGIQAHVGAVHATGRLFWQQFALQYTANWVAWSLILAILWLPVVWGIRRSRPSAATTQRGRSRSRKRRWVRFGVIAGVVSIVLPLFLLGLLILSRKDALSVLVEEGGLLVHLLSVSLLPGEGLLYWADGSLVPFSGPSPTMSFWLSSGILLLVNWVGWLLIATLVFRLVLSRIRAR